MTDEPAAAMSRARIGIVAALAALSSAAAGVEPLAVCGQKVNYQPTTTANSPASNLGGGVWVGEMLAFNTAYSQDYSRCWEIVIEDVSGSGIKAKVVLADNAKSIHNGTRYGTQGRVDPWKGQLDPSGSTLRFVSGDGETSYELQLKGSAAMEGKVVYPNGTGKLWLSKR